MSHSPNIDNEVNAPHQMRDVIFWGCAAVIAATTALSSYVWQSDIEFPKLASIVTSSENSSAGEPGMARIDNSSAGAATDSEPDNITTGSIPPKNTDKLQRPSSATGSASPFGTTVARRQSNADSSRRMREESENPDSGSIVSVEGSNIGQGQIGIDLGIGHSFSVLGKRYSALVNAAPTLFADLSARASIVEHETSIEAHLVAGPLKDVQAAQALCEKIRQRVNTTCQPTNFTGRKLKLY